MRYLGSEKFIDAMKLVWLLALVAVVCGCSASAPPSADQNGNGTTATSGPTATSTDGVGSQNGPDVAVLQSLLTSREREESDFAIGIGDVLEITVPDISVLQDQTVRVRGDGAITLPLLGSLQAAGLTEEQLQADLLGRLHKYLVHPQAEIFVKSYSSRQVAVLGAVAKPATYTLSGPSDTVRGLLERAGGMTEQAGQEILLIPASANTEGRPNESRAAAPLDPPSSSGEATSDTTGSGAQLVSARSTSAETPEVPDLPAIHPITISLAAGSNDRRYLDLPARPGDTIIVPLAGNVSVVGWVQTPKTIAISPGMTVLGAVSAAGGPLFAADISEVKIYRQAPEGEKTVLTVDLTKVQKREVPDIALRDNDVVQVPYSALKVPGYALYYAAQGVVSWAPAAALVSGG